MITWAGEPQEGEEQTLKKKSTAKAIKLCDIKFHLEEEEEEDEPPEPAAPATKTQRRYYEGIIQGRWATAGKVKLGMVDYRLTRAACEREFL